MWTYTLFLQILSMTLTASIVILFVLVARLLLKPAPKLFSYVLWAVVLFRLLCPVSIGSTLSLLNIIDVPVSEAGSVDDIPQNIVRVEYPAVQIPASGISETISGSLLQSGKQLGADSLETPISMLAFIWLIGIAG